MQQPGDRFFVDPDDLAPPFATPSVTNFPDEINRPSGAKPQVPPGFTVELFADNLGRARFIEIAPNGDVFLSNPNSGSIRVLRDADHNGSAETIATFATGFTTPHAMELRPDGLYVVDINRVWKLPYASGELAASGPKQAITPAGALGPGTGHNLHSLAFSADGQKIYVGIGSASNVNPENPPRATILEFDADGTDGHVYASGLRNPSALAINPATGELFATVVERDGLGDDLVPDFLTQIEAGGFYGWPYAYIGPNPQPNLGDDEPDLVAATLVPDMLFEAHSSPIGLAFYNGNNFPADYAGDAFVALRGSWNAAEPRGYMIVHVPFENGRPVGDYYAFATGFWADGDDTAEVWGRPTGVAVAPDGSLFIADDTGGAIWRIRAASDPPPPDPVNVSIAAAQIAEGNNGTHNLSFTVSLSAPTSEAVTVTAATTPGSATPGDDYVHVSTTVTIPAGATSGGFVVPIIGDTIDEPNETLSVILSTPSANAVLGGASSATATIIDDDLPPTVSISPASLTEGDSGAATITFTVHLSAPQSQAVAVTATTSDGTAFDGGDYVGTSSLVIFMPGQTAALFSVQVLGDVIAEGVETFVVTLSDPMHVGLGLPSEVTGTIVDDDAVPTISIGDISLAEGDDGEVAAIFTIALSNPTTGPVTVNASAIAGSASAGSDFTLGDGVVTIPAGAVSATFTVPVLGDEAVEEDETFAVVLSGPSANAVLGADATATATIIDDDVVPPVLPILSIGSPAIIEGQAAQAMIVFAVSLSAPATAPVSVAIGTVNGSAIAGSDYLAASDIVVIPAGALGATFAVPVLGDTSIEADETFTVALSAPVNAALGAVSAAQALIVNDDPGPDGLSLAGGGQADLLQGGPARDRLDAAGGNDTALGEAGDDTITGGADEDIIIGQTGDDTVLGGDGGDMIAGGAGDDLILGGDGDDNLDGNEGADTLDGGAGNDRIHADASDTRAAGGDGFDTLVITDNIGGLTSIDLSSAANQRATGNGPVLQGFEAVDASLAKTGIAVIGAASDGIGTVIVGSAFADEISGSTAADMLMGNWGDDVLLGLAGDDSIIADAGNDTLAGGDGADRFIVPGQSIGGTIRIADFEPGVDQIVLGSGLNLTPAQAAAQATQLGADASLALPNGSSIVFVGVSAAALSAGDFATL